MDMAFDLDMEGLKEEMLVGGDVLEFGRKPLYGFGRGGRSTNRRMKKKDSSNETEMQEDIECDDLPCGTVETTTDPTGKELKKQDKKAKISAKMDGIQKGGKKEVKKKKAGYGKLAKDEERRLFSGDLDSNQVGSVNEGVQRLRR
jgi:hypothetical protein